MIENIQLIHMKNIQLITRKARVTVTHKPYHNPTLITTVIIRMSKQIYHVLTP